MTTPNPTEGILHQLQKKWEPLLKGIDPKLAGALLENEARHLDKLANSHVGPFAKFAFPLIRRTYPSLIGGQPEEQTTPLQELTERAFAEHDPTDENWGDWVREVEAAYHAAAWGDDGPPEELEKEYHRVMKIEHPERYRPKSLAESIVSVQPMTEPVGGIAFYRPRYGTPKKEDPDVEEA